MPSGQLRPATDGPIQWVKILAETMLKLDFNRLKAS